MSFEFDLQTHAAANFVDVPRVGLEAYAKVLGVKPKADDGEDDIRARLCEKLGNVFSFTEGQLNDSPRIPEKKLSLGELYKLELSGRGIWQGRRRNIILSRPEAYRGEKPIFFGWGRQQYWIRPNSEVSIPVPVFNILRNAVGKRLMQVRKTLDDGQQTIRNIFTDYQRIPYSDLGDDPETIHLPVNQEEQFRLIAGMTNNFHTFEADGKRQKFSEEMLRQVAKRLNVRIRDLPGVGATDEVRARIMAKLKLRTGLEAIGVETEFST